MSVSAVSNISSLLSSQSVAGTSAATSAGQAASSTGVDFSSVGTAVDSLQGMQNNADALAVKAVTGDLDDIHDYTIAASQASVALELTAAVRNKAVEAFTEIMRMQA